MWICVESKEVDFVFGRSIYRQVDRQRNSFTFEFYGPSRVFYVVDEGDDFFESFKTLADARRYAKSLM